MNPISPLAGLATPATLREYAASMTACREQRFATGNSEDSIEIADVADALNQLANLLDDRARRIVEIRRAIAEGTYDTPERFEVAVDRLLADIASQE